jgi:hypothetical protein
VAGRRRKERVNAETQRVRGEADRSKEPTGESSERRIRRVEREPPLWVMRRQLYIFVSKIVANVNGSLNDTEH